MESRIMEVQSASGLSAVQLATSEQDTFEYIACGRGLAGGLLEIREVSASGSVITILVINGSDRFVFMMDGDILSGAKQDRVVNTSVLLAPRSRTAIPVSCVEQGRWSRRSPVFTGTNYSAPASLRGAKAMQVSESIGRRRGFASDQVRIWTDVASFHTRMRVASPTSSISDIYDRKAGELEDVASRFSPHSQANGVALFVGREFAGIDLFNRREVFEEYFPKLVRGAAFELEAVGSPRVAMGEPEARYRTLDLLDMLGKAGCDESPGVGVGLDRRFRGVPLSGFELVYGGHSIHLAAFNTPPAA